MVIVTKFSPPCASVVKNSSFLHTLPHSSKNRYSFHNMDKLIIKGAREHNLKNIDLELPRDKLIVISGLSGSGKSSLAFDTIFAEGQRRYVESLSAYARQFLGRMDKPDLDYIEGLSPAISIEQKTTHRNPRSTVGTVTEIYDYYRLLYARIGVPHCPVCGKEGALSASLANFVGTGCLAFIRHNYVCLCYNFWILFIHTATRCVYLLCEQPVDSIIDTILQFKGKSLPKSFLAMLTFFFTL